MGRPSGSHGDELLAVARVMFLELGFGGTTMAAVAGRAKISKASLYAAHPSKDDLYAAVVRDWAARGRDAMRPHLDALAASEDLRAGLGTFVATLQGAVLSPPVAGMRRLVAAEAGRFPDVARDYLADSWERNIAALGDTLGRLGIDRPAQAAQQLTWMALGAAMNEQTLSGTVTLPLDEMRDAAVETFLARYA